MSITRWLAWSMILGGSYLTGPVLAAQERGFVGLGVDMIPDYHVSDDDRTRHSEFSRYTWLSGRYVNLGDTPGSERALRVKANLIPEKWSRNWEAGPLLRHRLKRNDADDDTIGRIGNLDVVTEAGAFLGFDVDRWSAALSFTGDVSDEDKSYLLYLNGGYDLPISHKLSFSLGAHLAYSDTDYSDANFFGASDSDSRGNDALVYDADSGLKNWGLSLTGRYHFNKRWGMLGSVGFTRLFGDAVDSPLLNDRDEPYDYRGIVAATYSF